MNGFLLTLFFTLALTLGVTVTQKPINSNVDIDVSDYILPDEFFPENDRDAIPYFQQIPDIDVSQYTLPDEFYPENDRDAFPIRRFLYRRPTLRFQPKIVTPLHSTKLERLRGVENDLPMYGWNMKMRQKNLRAMTPFGNAKGIFDQCCPYQRLLDEGCGGTKIKTNQKRSG